MPASQFHLVTQWIIGAPRAEVWDALADVDSWPTWWHGVGVVLIERGGANGVGAYRRMTWQTALPYSIHFNMRATRLDKPDLIEGRADGELAGTGRWTLTPDMRGTLVRYDWIVEIEKPWMRLLAPVLRPVFAWNHDVVMKRGRRGLGQHLGTTMAQPSG